MYFKGTLAVSHEEKNIHSVRHDAKKEYSLSIGVYINIYADGVRSYRGSSPSSK